MFALPPGVANRVKARDTRLRGTPAPARSHSVVGAPRRSRASETLLGRQRQQQRAIVAPLPDVAMAFRQAAKVAFRQPAPAALICVRREKESPSTSTMAPSSSAGRISRSTELGARRHERAAPRARGTMSDAWIQQNAPDPSPPTTVPPGSRTATTIASRGAEPLGEQPKLRALCPRLRRPSKTMSRPRVHSLRSAELR